jgi:YegS/Rv2252/BmrU family lipid kinase
VIANPKAGKGAVGEAWERILGLLHAAGLEPLGDLTQHPGHATELARSARRDGRRFVVAAGGDGTVHEVVNGLLADGAGPDVPVLGVLALGSGCDYIKTFDLPSDLDAAVRRLASEDAPRPVDAGHIAYRTPQGEASRYFVNIAEVGIGPEVVDRAARLPRALGGLVYLAAFWLTLPRFRRRRMVADMDGGRHEAAMTNLVVAIGRVFGGGMRVAPGADPSDGLFDVQVHSGSKLDYVLSIPKVFKGTHLPHPKIHEARTTSLMVEADPEAMIEADGEVLGTTPATFRILPGAIRLKV